MIYTTWYLLILISAIDTFGIQSSDTTASNVPTTDVPSVIPHPAGPIASKIITL